GLFHGTVSVIDMPEGGLANLTKQAYACSPLPTEASAAMENVPADNPIPKKVGDPSPIKHVIYVIKENRTYDQMLGDLPQGYGEWIENGKRKADGTHEDGKAKVSALEGHYDPKYVGFELDYPDVKRAERFISELRRFEKEGGFPQLQIVRLPNDHTSGTKAGA